MKVLVYDPKKLLNTIHSHDLENETLNACSFDVNTHTISTRVKEIWTSILYYF